MMTRTSAYPLLAILVLLLATAAPAALAGGERAGKITDRVVELGQEMHCGIEKPQLRLLRPGQSGRLPEALTLSEPLQQKADQALAAQGLVLVVALGYKPTSGFGASLAEVELLGRSVLGIAMESREPASDEFVLPVITTPCTLLALPYLGWSELQVSLIRDGFPQRLPHPWRHWQ